MGNHIRVCLFTVQMADPPVPPSSPGRTPLHDSWTMWAHLPHDTDWSVKSYQEIMTFNTVEETASLIKALPEPLVRNCMLFLMRKGIHPTWEDKRNKDGGCFSYKVNNKDVMSVWRELVYRVAGESLTDDESVRASVNGITISPKKNFCIIKVWMGDCKHQDASAIHEIKGISRTGCLFKRHVAAG